MKIHEVTLETGALAPVELVSTNQGPAIRREEETFVLPAGAIAAVMKRYGVPLDPDAKKTHEVAALDLGTGERVRHVRHLDFYDVIGRDYLVYEAPGSDPVCAMATRVAAALEHLARAAAAPRDE